ncbi:MAG: transposon-encoded TnpW family protein [Defluviitaleaceae bacterium]|nr:transposon-encoded TnpW family protein [Defluviitaleaceae bacterium]MCL2263375.1 transposon-encoded TnpW family protein [Defluviitaleaceae bacterium]
MDYKKPPDRDMHTAYHEIPPTLNMKVGGTTYIITGKYKENAREGLLDKLWRLMQNDAE